MKTTLRIVVMILLAYPATATFAHDAKPQSWTGTVRGEVMQIEGDAFTIEDPLGRDVRLTVGTQGVRDQNIQIGDEVVARIVHIGKETYIKSVRKVSSPLALELSELTPVIEGQILKIDGESYVLKEIGGHEVRLKVDGKTLKDGNLTIGDKVQADIDDFKLVHARNISKR